MYDLSSSFCHTLRVDSGTRGRKYAVMRGMSSIVAESGSSGVADFELHISCKNLGHDKGTIELSSMTMKWPIAPVR